MTVNESRRSDDAEPAARPAQAQPVLRLNKETLQDLDVPNAEARIVVGAVYTPGPGCMGAKE